MMDAMSQPVSKPLPSKMSRRITVLVTYLAMAALIGVILIADGAGSDRDRLGPLTEGLLYLGLIPATVGGFILLKRNVRGIADLPATRLDERQLAERNNSYRTAYKVLGLLFVAVAMYTMVALTSMRWTLPLPTSAAQGHVIFWSVWFVAVTLPSVIMAWKEPDIPDEQAEIG